MNLGDGFPFCKRRWPVGIISLAVVILMIGSFVAKAATYYVDQSTGSDAGQGSNARTPWKNCPGMTGYAGSGTLRPGDTVFFNRSEVWLVSGTQGIRLTGGVTYIGNSWGTGTGKACLRAGSAMDSGVVCFTDNPTRETVFQGFNVDANRQVTTGVNINWAHWSLMNGATKRVKDCEVHDTWSRASLGQYQYGIIVSNFGGAAGSVENVEIINCVVHDTSRDAVCLYPGDVMPDCRIKNITVQRCEVYHSGEDPDYGAGAGIIVKGYVQDAFIEYNYVHDTKGALMFVNGNENTHYGVGPTNIHIRYNIFTGNTIHGAIRIYDGRSGQDPKEINIYGNLVYNSTAAGGFYLGSDLGNRLSLRIYNNTFYNAPVVILNNRAAVTLFEFKNNIVYCSGGVPLTDTKGQITSHSNNIFYRGNGSLVSSSGVNYNSSNLRDYEKTGSNSDPLFTDVVNLPTGFRGTYGMDLAPNHEAFRLQPDSPGIDKGIALPGGFRGSINSVGRPANGPWDIGAYEHRP
jgi:hypothetical protein